MSEVFTEKQEALVEQIKMLFYYPTAKDNIYMAAEAAAKSAGNPEEIITASIQELSYEQKTRRDYVVSHLTPRYAEISGPVADILTKTVATGGDPAAVSEAPANITVSNVSEQAQKEAKTYLTVAQQLQSYMAKRAINPQVRTLFADFRKIEIQELTSFCRNVKEFLGNLSRLEEDILDATSEIPTAISNTLSKTSVGLVIKNYDSVGEKISLLAICLAIAKAVEINTTSGANRTDEEILDNIGNALADGELFWE